ncbi:hypothetical protein LP7551_02117 [Roseibium album]|nr:hypothetical protein LP7551_02117 [Roseibium album]
MGKSAFAEPLSLANVENGLAGDMEQFLFRTWRENKGIIDRNSPLSRLSPYLLMTEAHADPGDVPQVTFAGHKSTFRRFFPDALENRSVNPPTSFLPEEYRESVADAYPVAFSGEPWFDFQRTGRRLGDNVPDMTLQRLLLKFRTAGGHERVFCLIKLLETHRQFDQSGRTHHRRNFRQISSWRPRSSAKGHPS